MIKTNSTYDPASELRSRELLSAQQYAEAIPHLRTWCDQCPDLGLPWSLLGTTYAALENWQESLDAFEKALKIEPPQPVILSAAGKAAWKLKKAREATRFFQTLIELEPDNAEAWNDLGAILIEQGKPDDAALVLERAVILAPDTAQYHYNFAVALRGAGRLHDALPHAQIATELDNSSATMTAHLGAILNELELYADAACAMGQLDIFASSDVLKIYCDTLRGQKIHYEAESALQHGLELDPNNAVLWFSLGNILLEQGKSAEAEEAFDQAIEHAPACGAYHRSKADLHRYQEEDPHLLHMLALSESADLPECDFIEIHFALGKAFDDLKEYERAIGHFHLANQRKRSTFVYDRNSVNELVDRMIGYFPGVQPPSAATRETISSLPVFVVGMPRSGTTLVEQILASHPDAVPLGERLDFQHAIAKFMNETALSNVPLTEEDFTKIGVDYLQNIASDADDAQRAIDKLPSNFFFLGFIPKALPNARIIHVRRSPVDTCISLYSKLFTQTQEFSYNLTDLGNYYRAYERIMDHWRIVLMPGSILEVDYESLVSNPKKEMKRMIAFIGLPWDDACLEFHESDRIVTTASTAQVRQPIYSSSVGRRKGYLPYLDELTEALQA